MQIIVQSARLDSKITYDDVHHGHGQWSIGGFEKIRHYW